MVIKRFEDKYYRGGIRLHYVQILEYKQLNRTDTFDHFFRNIHSIFCSIGLRDLLTKPYVIFDINFKALIFNSIFRELKLKTTFVLLS